MDAKEFEGLSRSQAQKFQAYFHNEYRAFYPPPKEDKVGFDWKFYASVAVSIFTVILAALRTSQMFYSAAVTSSKTWGLADNATQWLSYGDAFSSMFAIEAGLVVFSAIKNSNKDSVPDWIYQLQITLLLSISIFAGLGQSIGLVQGLDANVLKIFSYLLLLVLGVGASVAAWFSGEILGVQLQKFSVKKREAREHFAEQNRMYMQNARKFWSQRTEQSFPRELPTEQKSRTQNRTSPRTSTNNGTSEKGSLVVAELEKARTEQNKVLGYAELAEILRTNYPEQNFASNGYISTLRTKWISDHPEYFVQSDTVSD